MRYFLKKSTPSKKGLYLQIYQSSYVPGKGPRNKSYKAIGYYGDLVAKGIPDPIKYAQDMVDGLNEGIPNKREQKIGDASLRRNLGHFLLKSIWDYLGLGHDIDVMTGSRNPRFRMSDFILAMVGAQVVNPGSKHNAFEKAMPSLYGSETFTYSQILDAVNYIGGDYQKFIEVMNHHIGKRFPRKTGKAFFDCTNYYFEIDLPKGDRQMGPSKEERHLPIIGQALLLDEEQIPIGMSLYPGNRSEKPEIRKSIDELKSRFGIDSRIVQVADKGLNCARNVYAASKEAKDGYIFSKSVHGKSLSAQEKKWVLLSDDGPNKWSEVRDADGRLIFKYKECVDDFEYRFTDDGGKAVTFKAREKRVVSYNPSLARKQIAQIQKQVDRAKEISTVKQSSRSDYGDSAKYVDFVSADRDGEIVEVRASLNQAKIDEDMAFAGYNLLVSSEIDKPALEIYGAYHGLWRIEESFRVMKTYLEARPVYLQKTESIYGHFTICYLALTLLRLLELKAFGDAMPIGQLVGFIRNYSITETPDGAFINNACRSDALDAVKKRYALPKLDNAYLKKKDVDNILNAELFFD